MLKFLIVSSLFLAFAQVSSCNEAGSKNEVEKVFSVDSKVAMVFFFKKDTSKESRNEFYENVLNRPHPGGGYWPRDGIIATFSVDQNGFEGFGFKFADDATEEQRQDIRRVLKESPLVHRVYEDVVPNEINDL